MKHCLFEDIKNILDGIDRTDDEEDGWWETSTGAEFGKEKLGLIEIAINERMEAIKKK